MRNRSPAKTAGLSRTEPFSLAVTGKQKSPSASTATMPSGRMRQWPRQQENASTFVYIARSLMGIVATTTGCATASAFAGGTDHTSLSVPLASFDDSI